MIKLEDSATEPCKIQTSKQGHPSVPCEPDQITLQNKQNTSVYSNIPGKITDCLILPFLQAQIGISALRFDDTLHVRMPCAHAELERCRFAQNPAGYSFSGINATALDCGNDVERPEYPTTDKKSYD